MTLWLGNVWVIAPGPFCCRYESTDNDNKEKVKSFSIQIWLNSSFVAHRVQIHFGMAVPECDDVFQIHWINITLNA